MLDSIQFTTSELLFAAVVSFFLTWFIVNITAFRRLLRKNVAEYGYLSKDIGRILQRCYALFPVDRLSFRGETYKRGASIRITTAQQRIFEGELIGLNNKHMVCIMTKKHIIAHDLENIEDIKIIDKIDVRF